MYTEEADISTALVFDLVYAAVKYDIKLLLDECIEHIQQNAEEVLRSEELLSASQPVLRIVIERGCKKNFIDPFDCYVAAKKWALYQIKLKRKDHEIGEGIDVEDLENRLKNKRELGNDDGAETKEEDVFVVEDIEGGVKQNVLREELKSQKRNVDNDQVLAEEDEEEEEEEEEEEKEGKENEEAETEEEGNEEENTSPDEIRKFLGDVLDVIRFRDMPLQFFIERVATEYILPEGKKLSILIGINSKYSLDAVVCPTTNTYTLSHGELKEDETNFTVSTYVQLTHVSLFASEAGNWEVNGQLKIFSEGNNLLLDQNISLTRNYTNQNILLQKGVTMVPNVMYTVFTSIRAQNQFTSIRAQNQRKVHQVGGNQTMYQGTFPEKTLSRYGFTIQFMNSRQGRTPSQKENSLIHCLTFKF